MAFDVLRCSVGMKRDNRVLMTDRTTPIGEGLSREQRYLAKSVLAMFPRSWQRARRRIVVLCYHSVHPTNAFASATPEQFDEQMGWLKEHCDVIPLGEALDRAAERRDSPSKPAVSITFDDGYDDNFVFALPVLMRYGIKASFYVTTGFIDRDPEVVDRMRRMRGMAVSALRWEQLAEMRRGGMAVGSHTITHPNLAELAPGAVRVELRDSKRALEDHLGEEIDSIAYPYGIPGRHVTDQTIASAREAGFRTGVSILYRDIRQRDDALNIPRIAVKNNSLQLLKAKIVGSLDVIGRWQEYKARGTIAADDDGGTKTR
jgi:peptidoglycan/xylan/chitin deacetylase (PgdA/CDA1 family)